MTARTQAFILLLFGGALVRLATSDALLRYVRPAVRPWVLIAGLVTVVLAAWSLLESIRAMRRDSSAERTAPGHKAAGRVTVGGFAVGGFAGAGGQSDEDVAGDAGADVHGHGAVSRAAWLVVAPVVVILVVAPPALGSFSASRAGIHIAPPASNTRFDPLPAGTARLSLFEFADRALVDGGGTLSGHRVQLTGFVLRTGAKGFVLSRLAITCCAADAQPVDIGVIAGVVPARDQWVTVTGRFAGLSGQNTDVPLLQADAVTSVRQPTNPYDG